MLDRANAGGVQALDAGLYLAAILAKYGQRIGKLFARDVLLNLAELLLAKLRHLLGFSHRVRFLSKTLPQIRYAILAKTGA